MMIRHYRTRMQPGQLVGYRVVAGESDLQIYTATDQQQQASHWLRQCRQQLLDYIQLSSDFLTSLIPLPLRPAAPPIVRRMAAAAERVGVGPMAAVAGAVAEFVGERLCAAAGEVLVENGGDIWLFGHQPRKVLVYAHQSPWSERVALQVRPNGPLSVCASAGSFGHSLSFGRADAAVAISGDGALADATATAIGNLVKSAEDVSAALDFARRVPGLLGCLVIIGDRLGVWGDVELCGV